MISIKTGGFSLNIGKSEVDGKWKIQFIHLPIGKPRPQIDRKDCSIGVRFDIVWGPLVLPVAKMYHWKFWLDDPTYSQQWNNGNQWFTIKLPFFCFPFISVLFGIFSFGTPGFWIGARTADLSNKIDWQLRLDWDKDEYDQTAWAWNEDGTPKEAWPVGKYKGMKTVELTLVVRSDMRH
jgi:hypothetical protein